MAAKNHHFRLGLFLILGFLLFAAMLAYFSAGAIFTKTLSAETYFTESVQGLSIGSPLKYRGVKIGSVSDICLVSSTYPEISSAQSRLVLVIMDIDAEEIWGTPEADSSDSLGSLVEQGLRIKLASQGLTGIVYLEADFYPAGRFPPLSLDFTPRTLYIPTVPSTMYRVEQSLDTISNILGKIDAIDFTDLIQKTNDLLTNISSHIENANITRLGDLLANNLEELHKGLARINTLLADPAVGTILPDTAEAMSGIKEMVADIRKPVQQTVNELHNAAGNLSSMAQHLEELSANQGLEDAVAALPNVLNKSQNATIQLARGGEQLGQLLASFRQLVQAQQATIQAILIEAESALRNLNEFAEEAKRNPSRLLLGEPPGHSPMDQEKLGD